MGIEGQFRKLIFRSAKDKSQNLHLNYLNTININKETSNICHERSQKKI